MHTLTTRDITPQAIQQQLEYLLKCEEHLTQLKEQRQALQELIEKEESHLTDIKHDVQWRQLMAEVEGIRNEEPLCNDDNEGANSNIARLCIAFEDAIQKFKSSLIQPEDYGSGSGDESVIPYSDTDDYADFTVLEDVIEDALGEVESLLITNSATQSRGVVSMKSSSVSIHAQESFVDSKFSESSNDSRSYSFLHESESSKDQAAARKRDCGDSAEMEKENQQRRVERRRGLLLLLVLSLYVGRIEELCSFAEISDQSDVPSADADEARDSVVVMWQSLLNDSKILTEDERREWANIVSTYLGSPFDTPPLRSII
ncbi:unnamed protein product [Phytomonas sp. EM1]|nr:unnamed protein product [Phytomonas sp. EM1]|eukprot:CCW59678.1 unnamed protein product [Phytomonas sp. isolate EM1]